MKFISALKIMKEIDKYELISFDLYDTLINRNVSSPEDIFKLIEMKFADKLNNVNFFEERKTAYKKAYEKFNAKCTIKDIYNEMNNIAQELKNELMDFEIQLEKDICCKNEELFNLYSYALSEKKRIVIITDMYLEAEIIKKIIEKCGISGYEKLYVSCEYGMSKTNGELYDKCCDDLGISKKNMFHIGDGWKNDVIRARMKGINGYHYRKKVNSDYWSYKNFSYFENTEYSMQQAVINNFICNCDNEIEKLGFQTIGPLVYGFCLWLKKSLERLGINKIFFLAREGLFIKKIFETIYGYKNFECHYLYASRRSIVVPSYWIYPDYEDVVSSISKSSHVSVSSMFSRWGLEADKYTEEISSFGFTKESILDGKHLEENNQLRDLYNVIKDDIIQNSESEYSALKEYLLQENFNGNCAIVDIGWNGAMQKSFEKIISVMDENIELHGFYIGINTENIGHELNNINGYVYEQKKNEINRYYIYSFAGPLELSFTAAHGTTLGFKKEENKIVPVLGKGEYILSDNSWTKELHYAVGVQNGAVKFVEIMRQYMNYIDVVSSEVAFRNCRLFGLMPLKKHIEIFSEFEANDLGQVQHFVSSKYNKLFGENSIMTGFWSSTWKSGYMKRLFKLHIPYYKLYVALRKREKR